MRVGKPAAYGDGVLRMEYVRSGGIVDDYRLFQITTDLGQILLSVSIAIT